MLTILFGAVVASGAQRQVAITIDDLPRGGDKGSRSVAALREMTERLLKPFREQGIPVIGFVNQGQESVFGIEGLRQILDMWLESGAELGNHSYSHPNLNNVPLEVYQQDILRGESELRTALASRQQNLEFFRHPFLHAGTTVDIKKGLQEFLDAHSYRVAPVTFDNLDHEFAVLYTNPEFRSRVQQEYVSYMESIVSFFEQRSVAVVGREIPQILLIHANELNADLMPELLAMFRRRGYTFISLRQALQDSAYQLPDEYVGPKGPSWIHRWAATKGMTPETEPEPPQWLREAAAPRLR